ncbi:MAG: hypothetical protein AAF737_08245 [Pseudomonadota bacterium]
MRTAKFVGKLLCAAALVSLTQTMAFAADLGSANSGNSRSLVEKVLRTDPSLPLPGCEDKRVLKKITKRFNWAERNTWHRGFEINTLGHPQQKGIDTREDELSDFPLVPVRYCEVTAQMTNGQNYSMHYIIEAKTGFVGVSWGTEFCVHGLDPWRVYDGRCRVAHPPS